MAEYTAIAPQTVAINGNVIFTETAVDGCCAIIHREGSGIITLRGITNQKHARYHVTFGANASTPAGSAVGDAVSLAIAINGEAMGSATMITTPTLATQMNNVAAGIYVDVPRGCCITVSVKNIGTGSAVVQNANLIVEKVA